MVIVRSLLTREHHNFEHCETKRQFISTTVSRTLVSATDVVTGNHTDCGSVVEPRYFRPSDAFQPEMYVASGTVMLNDMSN